MEEFIEINDQFYVLAKSALADQRVRVLKHDDTLAVFDAYGDIRPVSQGAQGIYDGTTRYLSSLTLKLCGVKPMLLSSNVRYDNSRLTADLTNPDMPCLPADPAGDGHPVPRGTIHLQRAKVLWHRTCTERIRVVNFGAVPVNLGLAISFDADFKDMFEIRGVHRERHGERLPPRLTESSVAFVYRGLDAVTRATRLSCSPRPDRITDRELSYSFRLGPREERDFELVVACDPEGPEGGRAQAPYAQAEELSHGRADALRLQGCHVRTGNRLFDNWLRRSESDLGMMTTETGEGAYPYAGVPWFNTVFGRDGLLTAYQLLWANPSVAQGVLRYLAATQAVADDTFSDAEPGKILHELRRGEMVATGEVPFARYYGAVDSTPLYVVLADAYERVTGDLAFVRGIWPAVLSCLDWIDRHGDLDGDGFVEYRKRSPRGLRNQGWKDSDDSVFHADGELAHEPIALCEVQGYVYLARKGAARLARRLGDDPLGARLERQAEELRKAFEERFWCEELGTYGLALDGEKRLCRVRSSNAGQLLFTRIADPERARRVSEGLFAPDMFSGWGIRTVSTDASRYNPMSYHNGSIWPHDNAVIALGLARYGQRDKVLRLAETFFHVADAVDLNRLPELFCGFPRRTGEGPTLYPVACLPQAWAAGSVFLFLKSLLGIEIDGAARHVRFRSPQLSELVQRFRLQNLRVGDTLSDVTIRRRERGPGVELDVERKEGHLDVELVDVPAPDA